MLHINGFMSSTSHNHQLTTIYILLCIIRARELYGLALSLTVVNRTVDHSTSGSAQPPTGKIKTQNNRADLYVRVARQTHRTRADERTLSLAPKHMRILLLRMLYTHGMLLCRNVPKAIMFLLCVCVHTTPRICVWSHHHTEDHVYVRSRICLGCCTHAKRTHISRWLLPTHGKMRMKRA